MRLNEFPKHELENLLILISMGDEIHQLINGHCPEFEQIKKEWEVRVQDAIKDADFEEQQLWKTR